MTGYNVFRFCHRCEVAWRGEPACWNCGRPTGGREPVRRLNTITQPTEDTPC